MDCGIPTCDVMKKVLEKATVLAYYFLFCQLCFAAMLKFYIRRLQRNEGFLIGLQRNENVKDGINSEEVSE